MIAKLNKLSLLIGAPGFIFLHLGAVLLSVENFELLGFLCCSIGSLLLTLGILLYLKAKGRAWTWIFLIFLDIIGLVILYYLEDHYEKE